MVEQRDTKAKVRGAWAKKFRVSVVSPRFQRTSHKRSQLMIVERGWQMLGELWQDRHNPDVWWIVLFGLISIGSLFLIIIASLNLLR